MLREDLESAICAFIRDTILEGAANVTPEMPLTDLGLESFSLLEIILFVERKTGLSIPDTHLTRTHLHSVRSLVASMHDLSSGD